MKTEFEVKFLDINHDALRTKLQELGATLEQPMRLMKRVVIKTPELKAKNAFVRIRDEGHRATVTYKQFDSDSVDGAKEHEIVVDDFQTAIDLFEAAGLPYYSMQESKRETWVLDGAEVVLDEWPWLKPYIEIESDSEAQVKAVATTLGFDWNDAVFGDVMVAYRIQYPHLSQTAGSIGRIKEVKFDDPLPELLHH